MITLNFKKSVAMKTVKITFTLIMTLISSLTWGFVTVGTDASCDYRHLVDAYDDADVFVRVTTQAPYLDHFVISKPKWFTGGYLNCTDAENGIRSNNKSQWATLADRVIEIDAQLAGQSIVVIDGFEIYNGINNTVNETAGILVTGNSQLLLSDSVVRDNQSQSGGGLMVSGPQASVIVNNSQIVDNAAVEGGGLFCNDESTVTITGDSGILNNSANFGGGIYATEACQIELLSGDTLDPLSTQSGIARNTAQQGGGVFLTDEAQMQATGNQDHPASIVFNIADSDFFENGGGVSLTGLGTRFEGTHARVEYNVGSFYGGGFSVRDLAVFTMNRLPRDCWDNDRCSSLSHNVVTGANGVSAGFGGAGDLYRGGVANIAQTRIDGNQANDVAGFNLSDAAYLRLESNLVVNNRHFNDDAQTTLTKLVGTPGNGSNLDSFYNTFANNTLNKVLFQVNTAAQNTLNMFNSILSHNSDILLVFGDNANNNLMQWDCLFLNEVTSLEGNLGYLNISDPMFVNQAQGNYQLSPVSPAIDVCDESAFIGASYPDFDGQDRGIDEPGIQNLFGPFDVGAYEANVDIIFANGFE